MFYVGKGQSSDGVYTLPNAYYEYWKSKKVEMYVGKWMPLSKTCALQSYEAKNLNIGFINAQMKDGESLFLVKFDDAFILFRAQDEFHLRAGWDLFEEYFSGTTWPGMARPKIEVK